MKEIKKKDVAIFRKLNIRSKNMLVIKKSGNGTYTTFSYPALQYKNILLSVLYSIHI